jgi:hypothetical protein
VGGCRLLELLGTGGNAEVWKAGTERGDEVALSREFAAQRVWLSIKQAATCLDQTHDPSVGGSSPPRLTRNTAGQYTFRCRGRGVESDVPPRWPRIGRAMVEPPYPDLGSRIRTPRTWRKGSLSVGGYDSHSSAQRVCPPRGPRRGKAGKRVVSDEQEEVMKRLWIAVTIINIGLGASAFDGYLLGSRS